MKLLRQLDPGIKLCVAFALLMCLSTWLSLALLSQLSSMEMITAAGSQKLNRPAGDYAGARIWVILCIAGNVVLAALLALWLRAELTRPVRQAAAIARRIGVGDLRCSIAPGAGARLAGAPGALLASMQDMNDQLAITIARMRSGATSMSSGAGQIAAGNRPVATRAERQAAALEDAASALQQMGTRIELHERHAGDSAAVVATGSGAIAGMAGTLAALTASAQRIAGIVGVIDEIAFQTNILALHAAVDAARAGDAGSSLALMATEVGKLAQRCAVATRDIKAQIDDSTRHGALGTTLVEQAGQAMREVSCSVDQVRSLVASLADVGQAGAHGGGVGGIAQLSGVISALARESRHDARLAEEAATVAAQMRDQAGSLSRLVDAYLLGPEHAQPGPRIQLVANNPDTLSTPARARRHGDSASVVPVRQNGQRGGGAHQ